MRKYSFARFAEETDKHIKKFMQSKSYDALRNSDIIDDMKIIHACDDAVLMTFTFNMPRKYIDKSIADILLKSFDGYTRVELDPDATRDSRILKTYNRENTAIEQCFNDAAYNSMCVTDKTMQKMIGDVDLVSITVYKILIRINDTYIFRRISDFYGKIFGKINDIMMQA